MTAASTKPKIGEKREARAHHRPRARGDTVSAADGFADHAFRGVKEKQDQGQCHVGLIDGIARALDVSFIRRKCGQQAGDGAGESRHPQGRADSRQKGVLNGNSHRGGDAAHHLACDAGAEDQKNQSEQDRVRGRSVRGGAGGQDVGIRKSSGAARATLAMFSISERWVPGGRGAANTFTIRINDETAKMIQNECRSNRCFSGKGAINITHGRCADLERASRVRAVIWSRDEFKARSANPR